MRRRSSILFIIVSLLLISCSAARRETLPQVSYVIASWYGPDFHGRPTSSGEIYNMYSHTCAHKEFPFGTRLRVMNTANFRNSECIVNDRGPFVAGRDLDLSYTVAKEIGLIGTGTGRVMIEILGRDNSYVRKAKVDTREKTGPFVIQVGSFYDGVNAIRLKTALSLEYNNVRIDETEVKGTKYYRVRVGDYKEWQKTVDVAEKLGQEGYQAVVLKGDAGN